MPPSLCVDQADRQAADKVALLNSIINLQKVIAARTSTSDWINKTFCYATAKQLAMDLSFSLASRNR